MCGCLYQWITAYNGCIFSLDIKIINIYAFDNMVHCHTSKDMYLLSQSILSSNIMINFYTAEVYLDIKMYIHGYQRYQLISKMFNPWTCMRLLTPHRQDVPTVMFISRFSHVGWYRSR